VLLITNIEPLYGVEEVLRKISLDHPQEIVPVTCVGGPARDLPNMCIMCYFTDEDRAVDAFLSLNRQMVQGHKIMSYLLVCWASGAMAAAAEAWSTDTPTSSLFNLGVN
jgi:hypothetical protein